MSFFKPIKRKIRNGSRKLAKEIEKLKIYCSGGYKKIQPRVFGRAVLTMVHPSIIETEEDNYCCRDQFKPSLGSLKKREVIDSGSSIKYHTSEMKQQIVELPEKEILTFQIVPSNNKVADHTYNVRFTKVTPGNKVALLRRQSTAPEFI